MLVKVLSLLSICLAQANVCEGLFSRNYDVSKNSYVDKYERKELHDSFDRVLGVKSLEAKTKHLENYYNELSLNFNSHLDDIYEDLYDLDLNKTQFFNHLEKLENKLHSEFIPYNNRAVLELKSLCDNLNINTLIESRVLPGGFRVDYLTILESSNTKRDSIQRLFKFKAKSANEIYTVDLFENMRRGSMGFQNLTGTQIDIGFSGLKSILLQDELRLVAKHESYHGIFKSLRERGEDSIYHINFKSNNGTPLSNLPTTYKNFMSAEEVYNFANNPFWDADFLSRSSKSLSMESYIKRFEQLDQQLTSARAISDQSEILSKRFIKTIDDILVSNRVGTKIKIQILDENLILTQDLSKAYYFSIKETNSGFEIFTHISKKYRTDIASAFSKSRKTFNSLEPILKNLMEDLVILEKVSKKLSSESVLTHAHFKTQSSGFIEKLSDRDFIKSRQARLMMVEMRKDLRKLGNIVKTNYKGFAGN